MEGKNNSTFVIGCHFWILAFEHYANGRNNDREREKKNDVEKDEKLCHL